MSNRSASMVNSETVNIALQVRGLTTVPIEMNLADRIREAREYAGLTKAELARKCGVSRASVSAWESGSVNDVRNEHLFTLEKVTGYCAKWIGTEKGPRTRYAESEVAWKRSWLMAEALQAIYGVDCQKLSDELGISFHEAEEILIKKEVASEDVIEKGLKVIEFSPGDMPEYVDGQQTPEDVEFREKNTAKLLAMAEAKKGGPRSAEAEMGGGFDPWDSETPLGSEELELPFFDEVELSAGSGATEVQEIKGKKLRFAKSTLKRAGVPPEAAACVTVRGNSMEPVMPDGTCVGVNTADRDVRDGEIYAINHSGMLRVKYLHRRPGGGLKIVSQNAAEHPAEEVPGEFAAENIKVIGRVFWWSVLR